MHVEGKAPEREYRVAHISRVRPLTEFQLEALAVGRAVELADDTATDEQDEARLQEEAVHEAL